MIEFDGVVMEDRPPTIHEMVDEITEYHINNMSWADIKGILAEYYAYRLSQLPPEALREAYDSLFNR